MSKDSTAPYPSTHPLGTCLHELRPKPSPRRRNWSREIAGIAGATLVPVGLSVMEGTTGIIVAICGGLIAGAAYILSGQRPSKSRGLTIAVHEEGIVCSQGNASRQLVWNEVIDITQSTIDSPAGNAIAISFEVAAEPPLVILLGGAFSDESGTMELLRTLQHTWIPRWSRRAALLSGTPTPLRLGLARLTTDGLALSERVVPWTEIAPPTRDLPSHVIATTTDRIELLDPAGPSPFPSVSLRAAFLQNDQLRSYFEGSPGGSASIEVRHVEDSVSQ